MHLHLDTCFLTFLIIIISVFGIPSLGVSWASDVPTPPDVSSQDEVDTDIATMKGDSRIPVSITAVSPQHRFADSIHVGMDKTSIRAILGQPTDNIEGTGVSALNSDALNWYATDAGVYAVSYDVQTDLSIVITWFDTNYFAHLLAQWPHPQWDEDYYEAAVLQLANGIRAQHSLPPLRENQQLQSIARLHSIDMADLPYFSHWSPSGVSPFERIRRANPSFTAAGENLSAGQPLPQCVIADWLASPAHRKVLLGNYSEVGVGASIGSGPYDIYCTADFMTP